jgi:hypothetical protein
MLRLLVLVGIGSVDEVPPSLQVISSHTTCHTFRTS